MTKEITQEEIQEIERLTGGKIGTHTFGPNNEHTLENSFLSPDGTYIGNLDRAQWYVSNKMMVDDLLNKNWDNWMDEMDGQEGCEKITIGSGQYLSDVID